MIFPSQLKIGQRDRNEGGHNHKHNEGEEQDPKKRIDFMAPDRCEDMVQLDVDGRKRQEACHEELCQGVPVPVLHIRDLYLQESDRAISNNLIKVCLSDYKR